MHAARPFRQPTLQQGNKWRATCLNTQPTYRSLLAFRVLTLLAERGLLLVAAAAPVRVHGCSLTGQVFSPEPLRPACRVYGPETVHI